MPVLAGELSANDADGMSWDGHRQIGMFAGQKRSQCRWSLIGLEIFLKIKNKLKIQKFFKNSQNALISRCC